MNNTANKQRSRMSNIIYWATLVLFAFITVQAFRYGIGEVQTHADLVTRTPNGVQTSVLVWINALEDAALLGLITVALAARSRAVIWLSVWFSAKSGLSVLVTIAAQAIPLVLIPLAILTGLYYYLIRTHQL